MTTEELLARLHECNGMGLERSTGWNVDSAELAV